LTIEVEDWGRTSFTEAWNRQRERHDLIARGEASPVLILTEHHPVFTLGASFRSEHLLHTEEELRERGFDVVRVDRGGDVTYHGPGQVVAYPLLPLQGELRDLHRYLRTLEQVGIDVAAQFAVTAGRRPPDTGVWVGDAKVAAIGIKVSRRVTLHGMALNVDMDMLAFRLIVPCGIRDGRVASLAEILGHPVPLSAVKSVLIQGFQRLFDGEVTRGSVVPH
jgi:lipoate-protein ligase B